ncbi:MAG TPA: SIMPL domain-containing protein, partial [Acidimicrobiales bacterium]|nr:SIMPL domain-containing protein [Acidimicrobiales bacterium]
MSKARSGRWSRIAVGSAILLVAVGSAATATVVSAGGPAAAASTKPRCGAGAPKVTVTGTGKVSVTPNLLTLSLDVHTTAPEASGALSANNTATQAVLHALSAGGIARRDVQTTNLTIQPNYVNTGSSVTSYGVDNTVVAKIRKFTSAGTVIDAAVGAGGNATRINSMAFSLTRPLHAQGRARTMAVHQAIGHAKAIALSANEHLRGICSIHDMTSTSTTSPPPYYGFKAAESPSAAGAPVEAGSQTVTSRVQIVFAL